MNLFSIFYRWKNLNIDRLKSVEGKFTALQIDLIKKHLGYFPVNTEVSFAFISDDKVTFAGVMIDKDSLVYAENSNSVFEIGSITKVFTSVLLSKFISDGIVKANDPIKNYFAFPLKQSCLNGKEITLENLANHTSGLPRIDIAMLFGKERANKKNPFSKYDEEKLTDYLTNRMRIYHTPGTKFKYSNLGGGLLAYILCKQANKTYEELLHNYIFSPFNMNSSTTDLSTKRQKLVKGLTINGNIAENWEFTGATTGAGSIKSTAKDIAHFIQAHFNNNDRILQLPLQKTFHIKETTDIGLAWLITQKNKRTVNWHNGGTGGYRSCIAIDIVNKKGLILLSNVSAFHPKNQTIDELCFQLQESMG